jgi:hypothetical protein
MPPALPARMNGTAYEAIDSSASCQWTPSDTQWSDVDLHALS